MDIYLDTNLWNELYDQGVVPEEFVRRLARKKLYLALGTHDFYELAKNFRRKDSKSHERGKVLLAYFKRYIEADVHIVKDNQELLAAEMWALKLKKIIPETFLLLEDRAKVLVRGEELANGKIREDTENFLREQERFALSTRSNQIQHLDRRADIKTWFKSVTPEKFEAWLETESRRVGVGLLVLHIQACFPEATPPEAMEYANALQAASMRFSRALVRSDLYYSWRCATRGSVPKDLIDDMYHVLNAVYCDVYASRETKQADYAHLLLTLATRVAIYDRSVPVDEWIEKLA